jgi:hypothetical protein
MIAVAIAGWIFLNLRFWVALESEIPPTGKLSVIVSRAIAWIACPAIALLVVFLLLRSGSFDGSMVYSIARSTIAWACGGGLAWLLAACALFIGQPADGMIPMFVTFVGLAGAVCSGAPGFLIGFCGWLLHRRGLARLRNRDSIPEKPDPA